MPRALAPRWAAHKLRYGSVPAPTVASSGSPAGSPPDPTEIPYIWLAPPLTFRPERPINSAVVNQNSGVTTRRSDRTSQNEWGVNTFTETLHTAVDADPGNLGDHIMTFYATQPGAVPRSRSSAMTFNLLKRTQSECQRLLRVARGERIRITDAPADWPQGATELVVEGRASVIAVDERWLSWWVAPVIGSTDGVSGPWFRWDASSWDGTDLRPF